MFILYVIRTKLYKVLGESIDRIGLLAKKVVSYIKVFLSVNIFIIKQSMLLTFLPLLRIAGSGDWKNKKTDCRIEILLYIGYEDFLEKVIFLHQLYVLKFVVVNKWQKLPL